MKNRRREKERGKGRKTEPGIEQTHFRFRLRRHSIPLAFPDRYLLRIGKDFRGHILNPPHFSPEEHAFLNKKRGKSNS